MLGTPAERQELYEEMDTLRRAEMLRVLCRWGLKGLKQKPRPELIELLVDQTLLNERNERRNK